MLQVMKKVVWPAEHINAMLNLWLNLDIHKWCHNLNNSAHQALIFYQATYCHWWHDTLGTTLSCNPKHLDQDALIHIKAKINYQKYQATKRQAREVS